MDALLYWVNTFNYWSKYRWIWSRNHLWDAADSSSISCFKYNYVLFWINCFYINDDR